MKYNINSCPPIIHIPRVASKSNKGFRECPHPVLMSTESEALRQNPSILEYIIQKANEYFDDITFVRFIKYHDNGEYSSILCVYYSDPDVAVDHFLFSGKNYIIDDFDFEKENVRQIKLDTNSVLEKMNIIQMFV